MNATRTALAARDFLVAACPVVALVVVRLWIGSGGPAMASASAPQTAVPVVGIDGHQEFVPLEAESAYLRAAAEIVQTEAPDIFPRMVRTEEFVEQPVEEPTQSTAEPVEEVQSAPDLVVTSIMAGRVPMAIIDGRAHKVGDRVGPGWSITEIVTGRVTIGHLDGRTKVIRIERHGP